MAELFTFGVADPEVGETAAYKIECWESSDGLTGWALVPYAEGVDAATIGDFIPDEAGEITITWDDADPATYHRLVTVSVGGVDRPVSDTIPPRPTDQSVVTVYCYTIDAGMGIKAGVSFSVTTKSSRGTAGQRVIIDKGHVVTDATGYASLTIPADAGILRLALDSVSAEIDTTGRAGQVINLVDLL